MPNKALAAAAAILILAIGASWVQVAVANPIPWPSTPNQEKPTITIQSPENKTAYNGDVHLNFTLTIPDSWKTGPMPPPYIGQVASVKAYLDGNIVSLSSSGAAGLELWLNGLASYSAKLDQSASGLHTLNVTVLSHTYYTGPAYNGSHILYYTGSSGPVYKYPIVVSDSVYFTVEKPEQTASPKSTSPNSSNVLNQAFYASIVVVAVIVATSVSLVYFRTAKSKQA